LVFFEKKFPVWLFFLIKTEPNRKWSPLVIVNWWFFPSTNQSRRLISRIKMIFFMWFICHFFSKEVQRSLQNFLEQWNIFIALINKNKIIGCYESFWKFTFFSHNEFIKLLLNSKLIKIYFGIIIWFFHYNQICKEVNWSFIIIKKY
jgi:hypothetical protein